MIIFDELNVQDGTQSLAGLSRILVLAVTEWLAAQPYKECPLVLSCQVYHSKSHRHFDPQHSTCSIMHAHAVQQQRTIKSLCPEPFGPFDISLTFHNLGLKLAIIDMGFVSMNPMQQRRQHATLRGQVQLSKWQQTATNYCFVWHRQDQKQICRLDTAQYWRTLSAIGNLVKGNSTHLSDCATFSVCNDMPPRCC